jgi:hypothetical protein
LDFAGRDRDGDAEMDSRVEVCDHGAAKRATAEASTTNYDTIRHMDIFVFAVISFTSFVRCISNQELYNVVTYKLHFAVRIFQVHDTCECIAS